MVLVQFIQDQIPPPPTVLLSLKRPPPLGTFWKLILLSHMSFCPWSVIPSSPFSKQPPFPCGSLFSCHSLNVHGSCRFLCRIWRVIISHCIPSNTGSTGSMAMTAEVSQVLRTEATAGSPMATSILVPLHSCWVNVGSGGPLGLTSLQKRLDNLPNRHKAWSEIFCNRYWHFSQFVIFWLSN